MLPSAGSVIDTTGGRFGYAARNVRKASRRPPDATTPVHCPLWTTLSISSAFTALTERFGFAPMRSAATPATWGVAMLVPLDQLYEFPYVLKTFTPGAARSTVAAP